MLGYIFSVRQLREALTANHADANPDGTARLGGDLPIFFLGIIADDNDVIVSEGCVYYVDGEPRRLIDSLPPHDPVHRFTVI